MLEMLEPTRSRRPVNPLFQGAYAFDRIENARLAWYARDFLLGQRRPAPENVPTPLQKDLDLLRVRLIECRDPRDFDVWIHSALRVAALVNPHLAPDDAGAIWTRVQASPCYPSLNGLQRDWIALLRAVALRDATRMASGAEELLTTQAGLAIEAREYLLMAAMTGRLAAREPRAGPAPVEGARRARARLGARVPPAALPRRGRRMRGGVRGVRGALEPGMAPGERRFYNNLIMRKAAAGFQSSENALSPQELELAQLIVTTLNLEIDAAEIAPHARLYGEGLGLDSIDILEIALAISKAYRIRLKSDDEDNVRIFSSLRSLHEHIQKLQSG